MQQIMSVNKPSRIAPPSGMRTPSPTKSRLPIGSTLPQRTASIKDLKDATLLYSSQRPPEKASETARSTISGRTRLQQSNAQAGKLPAIGNVTTTRALSSKAPSLPTISDTPGQPDSIISTAKRNPALPSPALTHSRETLDSRLRMLHLHVIHKNSSRTLSEWQNDAKLAYKQKFEELQHQNTNLNQAETANITQTNAAAILSWINEGSGLEKQFGVLSAIIEQIEALTGQRGRYTLAVQAFEDWMEWVSKSQDERTRSLSATKVNVIEGLGDGWLAEIEGLQVQLVNAADTMLGLADLPPGTSDLERVIAVVSEMLKNMLEELDMIQVLENSTVSGEKQWMQESIESITQDLHRRLSLR